MTDSSVSLNAAQDHPKSVGNQAVELFPSGRIRLAELTVCNWGSFGGIHSAKFHPDGTMIAGENGAGKSTFLDGLTALMLPPGRATFNVAAAQNDKTDRNLVSYIRGSYGSAEDGAGTRVKSKREGAVVSGARALYRADDGSEVTLCVLFWMRESGSVIGHVQRNYFVAKRNVEFKAVLDAFGNGDVRNLRQWLKSDPTIFNHNDNFSAYQEAYRHYLHMQNSKAPALLARAQGLKKIEDLTDLIRNLVLEPSDLRENARELVSQFQNLSKTHDEILDARHQIDYLAPLPALAKQIRECVEVIANLDNERRALEPYIGELAYALWNERLKTLEQQLAQLDSQIEQTDARCEQQQIRSEELHADYMGKGGDRIAGLRKDLEHANKALSEKSANAARYRQDIAAIELDQTLSQSAFIDNQVKVRSMLEDSKDRERRLQDEFGIASKRFGDISEKLRSILDEMKDIKARPNSSIQRKFQEFRDRMIDELQLDPERIVFIGELMDVKDDQMPWKGAIERALSRISTTLLVPESDYGRVQEWVNENNLRAHGRFQEVKESDLKAGFVQFNPNGFAVKLRWKEHPYRDYAKYQISERDLTCVDHPSQLRRTPYSMTREGLINWPHGRSEKNDNHRIDDRNAWNLGFSNTSRLSALQEEMTDCNNDLQQRQLERDVARNRMNQQSALNAALERLQSYEWKQIDVPYWQEKVTEITQDLARLESEDGDLSKALKLWEESKAQLKALQQVATSLASDKGALDETIRLTKTQQQAAFQKASRGITELQREMIARRVSPLVETDLERLSTIESEYLKAIMSAIRDQEKARSDARTLSVTIMSSFRSHERWSVHAENWGADETSIEEYIGRLSQLTDENLPALTEQFRDRLSRHATQGLAHINEAITSERNDIRERIDTINRVLRRTEFNHHTHLRLRAVAERFPNVVEYERLVYQALSQSSSTDYEDRFARLKAVIAILDKASHPSTCNTQESQRLLDARHQMSFKAEEVRDEDGQVVDVLDSSSGKSGGEKESFAGTIVAASLAYVLTPDGCDHPIYSTVILDEAFSNTSEERSRRVMRVFKELGLHLNLITPFKNLNLARECASSLIIAERSEEHHSSQLSSITWQQLDEMIEQKRQQELKEATASADINVHPTEFNQNHNNHFE